MPLNKIADKVSTFQVIIFGFELLFGEFGTTHKALSEFCWFFLQFGGGIPLISEISLGLFFKIGTFWSFALGVDTLKDVEDG